MDALTAFRANAAGHLSPTRADRAAAARSVASNYLAKAIGLQKSVSPTAKMEASQELVQPDELDRNAFLTLLVTQLQNQDPLEPVENTDMIAQLAQFSSLEQMSNLNESFERFELQTSLQNEFLAAQGLIGRYVTGVSQAGAPVSGMVDSVGFTGQTVLLSIDGTEVSMGGIVSVSAEPPDDGDVTGPDNSSAAAAAKPLTANTRGWGYGP